MTEEKSFPEFLIFDYDGVIVNSTPFGFRKVNRILSELGKVPIPPELLRHQWGKKSRDLLCWVRDYKSLSEDEFDYLVERNDQLFGTIIESVHNHTLNKEIVKAISSLREFGFSGGIITSRYKDSLEMDAERIGLDLSIFDYIQTADDYSHHKPDGRVFTPLIDRVEEIYYADTTNGWVGQRIAYFGDTLRCDYAAVKDARPIFGPIKFIGVCSGANTFEEFQLAGIDEKEIVPSYDTLAFFLNRLMQEESLASKIRMFQKSY